MNKTQKQWGISYQSVIGASVMFIFGLIAIGRWYTSGYLFFLLLALRGIVAAFNFIIRKPAAMKSSWKEASLSYISCAIPLTYVLPSEGIHAVIYLFFNITTILGFLIVTLATIELGSLFGISPAIRGNICKKGIYRWLKHPMYVGYSIAEFHWIVINPVNITIYVISMTGYWIRARWENRLFQDYFVIRNKNTVTDSI